MAIQILYKTSDNRLFTDELLADSHEEELREEKLEKAYERLHELAHNWRAVDSDLLGDFVLSNSQELVTLLNTINTNKR